MAQHHHMGVRAEAVKKGRNLEVIGLYIEQDMAGGSAIVKPYPKLEEEEGMLKVAEDGIKY